MKRLLAVMMALMLLVNSGMLSAMATTESAEEVIVIEETTEPAAEENVESEEAAEAAEEPVIENEEPVEATEEPVVEATEEPVVEATEEPVVEATEEPVVEATEEPVVEATDEPVVEATEEPVVEATEEPVVEATEEPVVEATEEPVVEATEEPVVEATEEPVVEATEEPVIEATEEPVVEATEEPVVEATEEPVVEATEEPVVEATEEPVVEEDIMDTAEELAEVLGMTMEDLAAATGLTAEELSELSAEQVTQYYEALTIVSVEKEKATAADFTVSNGVLTAWSGSDAYLVIPSNLGITAIGDNVFKGKTALQSVTIPSGVVSIGYRSFSGCTGLRSVTMPGTLTTIGEEAFYGCTGLPDITIQSGVVTIGYQAFENCTGLQSVLILGRSLKTVSDYAFKNCTALESITLPNSTLTVGAWAFENCDKLAAVNLGNGLTTMGEGAFYDCDALNGISIPGSLTTIPRRAFQYCDKLAKVTINSGVITIADGADYTYSDDYGAFAYCYALTDVSLPSTLTHIGVCAFTHCSELKNINFPSSLKTISVKAFSACVKLPSFTLSSGFETIGASAFYNCDSVKTVDVGGAKTVGDWAFENCTGLQSINLRSITYLGEGAFYDCDALTSISIPGSITTLRNNTFRYCDALKTATVNSGITTIADGSWNSYSEEAGAFAYCPALETVSLPNSLTYIGECAFVYCSGLKNVNIPGSVTKIQERAFSDCTTLANVTVPRSVTVFGANIFTTCPSLTIKVYEGSQALTYVQENGYNHITLPAPKINSVTSTQTRLSDGVAQVTFTVKTTTSCDYVMLYSENDSLVKVFSNGVNGASYTTSGSVRTWTIKYNFVNDGDRYVIFRGSPDQIDRSAPVQHALTVVGLKIHSAAFSTSSVKVGVNATITVKTNIGAKHLRMYAEGGNRIKTWTAAGNSTVSGNVRVWTVQYAFNGVGNRTMMFRTSYNGKNFIATGEKTAKITVTPAIPTITSASFNAANAKINTAAGITVVTSANANYLRMYGEGGAQIKTWPASGNSTVSGNTRTWKVSYAFGGAGIRTMTFKASWDGSTMSTGKKDSILILSGTEGTPTVSSAVFSPASIQKGKSVSITVKTTVGCNYVAMYGEGGGLIKKWEAPSNSTVSGSTRIWKLSYTFNGIGTRKMTFKSSVNGSTWSSGKTASVKVIGTVVNMISASASDYEFVANKDTTTITAYTPTNANYLHLLGEGGAIVKTWNASSYSYVSGSNRIWSVPFQFAGGGTRNMTIKCSNDGSTLGTGVKLTFNVTSTTAISLSAGKNVTLAAGESAYFVFTPSTTGSYTFYSTSDTDTYGYLFDSTGTRLAYDDDDGAGYNFSITYNLTAGQKYVLQARFYSSSRSGSFYVYVTK